MIINPSPPSYNPADYSSLNGAIAYALRKFLMDTDDMLPAQVLAYNRATNRVRVQIMVPAVTTGNQVVQRATVASIPVLQLGGGGFVVSFPINAGDLGWIKANDRDISIFNATLNNASGPPTQRLHKFSDAIFIPDTMFKDVAIAGEDANNLVIQNNAGTVKVSWWSNLLKILAPNGVGINGTPRAGTSLDLQSTTKALALPAMTTAQKTSIASPAAGYTVYDTDALAISSYNGSTWS